MSLNPFYWLHLRISGSARTNVVIVSVFAAVIIAFYSISFSIVDRNDAPSLNGTWLMIMTLAQAAFLLLLGPAAVRRAVQRDFDNGMIESHRLTPMSNLKVVLGYLSGAPVQAEMLYAVSLLFGIYFASRYALSPGLGGVVGLQATLLGVCFAQGCLLMLSLMICSMILLSALATRGKANVIGIMVVVCLFGGWMAIAFVPGLSLLLGIMSGTVLFTVITKGQTGGDPSVIAAAALLQLLFSLIALRAACGQLRGLDKPLFSIRLGLLLLLVWGFTLVGGDATGSALRRALFGMVRLRLCPSGCFDTGFRAGGIFPTRRRRRRSARLRSHGTLRYRCAQSTAVRVSSDAAAISAIGDALYGAAISQYHTRSIHSHGLHCAT